jgi:membrane protease YdiL (CAAX protease family)
LQDIRLPATKLLSELLIVSGLVILGLFAGTMIALATAKLFFPDSSLEELMAAMGQMGGNRADRYLALYMQGMAAGFGFGVAPWLFAKYLTVMQTPEVIGNKPQTLMPWLLSIAAMAFFVPMVSYLESWNKSLVFPESLQGLESWFRAKEDEIAALTKWLVQFNSFSDFLLAFVVIAIIAGVTEEWLFRGVVQPRLIALFGNSHVGIWVTGFVFAAIHVQFYGLFPRMMLGIVLGYLVHFSGKLQYAMLGHILNNGMVVIFMYLNQLKITDFDLEGDADIPWYLAAVSLVATFWLLTSFRNYYRKSTAIY